MNIGFAYPPQVCTGCGETKSFTEFPISNWKRDYLSRKCQKCVSRRNFLRRKANPGQVEIDRRYNLRHHRGMTLERYDELLTEQNGVCAICKKPETMFRQGKVKRLAVDHDHKTGENRGLLCNYCNVAIGYFRESPAVLQSAIDYINQYKKERTCLT